MLFLIALGIIVAVFVRLAVPRIWPTLPMLGMCCRPTSRMRKAVTR
jgi:hypothetical protein